MLLRESLVGFGLAICVGLVSVCVAEIVCDRAELLACSFQARSVKIKALVLIINCFIVVIML